MGEWEAIVSYFLGIWKGVQSIYNITHVSTFYPSESNITLVNLLVHIIREAVVSFMASQRGRFTHILTIGAEKEKMHTRRPNSWFSNYLVCGNVWQCGFKIIIILYLSCRTWSSGDRHQWLLWLDQWWLQRLPGPAHLPWQWTCSPWCERQPDCCHNNTAGCPAESN